MLVSTPSSTSLAPRPGPKAKPLAARQSLSALQLARPHLNPIMTTTTDGLLAQFKANNPTEIDSDSNNPDIRRRSYTQEQKLAAWDMLRLSTCAKKEKWSLYYTNKHTRT